MIRVVFLGELLVLHVLPRLGGLDVGLQVRVGDVALVGGHNSNSYRSSRSEHIVPKRKIAYFIVSKIWVMSCRLETVETMTHFGETGGIVAFVFISDAYDFPF